MPNKKRGRPDIEEILARPWCYYCERDFDDLKILISHQKAKHFKCERCGRRLNTAGGLSVHMSQVHKETLGAVENALPNRSNLDVEIFGMEGIPEDIVQQHNQVVLSQFQKAELEHRANSGNPAPGAGAGGAKKPKHESPSDLKKRLAEHKAKKAAQEAGLSSGNATPLGTDGIQSPGVSNSPGPFQPQMQQAPPSYPNFPGGSSQPSYPQPYGQPGYPPQQSPFPQQPQPFAQGPPGYPQPPSNQFTSLPTQYQQPPPLAQNGGHFQHQYGPSSPSQFGAQMPLPMQPNRQASPLAQSNAIPPRPAGLPAAPGLPQRPSVPAPAINAFQMQQLHQGTTPNSAQFNHVPAQDVSLDPRTRPTNGLAQSETLSAAGQPSGQPSPGATSVDELIASAAKESQLAEANKAAEPAVNGEKKAKKDKDKNKATRLVYSDLEVSPEEKMAKLPRYAFVPHNKGETVLGTAPAVAAAGGADEPWTTR